MEKFGIYIHIPFCVKKCKYCDFTSYTNCQNNICEYVQALCSEIKKEKDFGTNKVVDTIYFGGGTPSFIDSCYIGQILTTIRQNFKVHEMCEISIECNPNSLTKEKVKDYVSFGINRVSIGLQAKGEKQLRAIGRVHTKYDYERAVKYCKEEGLNNINTDVMFGLPLQSYHAVKSTIKLAMKYSTHISAYSLILEEGTILQKEVAQAKVTLPKEDKVVKWYEKASRYLKHKGYDRYEVSNFALKGFECLHNLHCWQYHDYLGFGVASTSKMGDKRFSRVTSLKDYCDRIQKGQSTIVECEQLDREQLLEEYIMLGLRTREGVQLHKLIDHFGYDLQKEKSEAIKRLSGLHLIEITKGRIRLLDDGYYVMNSIIVELLPD